jgi:hypothetical protein
MLSMLRKLKVSLSAVLLIAGVAVFAIDQASASPDTNAAFIGTWQGTWSGDSSGKFEMTITQRAGSKLSGSISPKPDDGDGYTAAFTSVEIASGKLSAKWDDPGGEVEITVTGSAEGTTAKGTYAVKQKSDGTQVDSGSWTATKKQK